MRDGPKRGWFADGFIGTDTSLDLKAVPPQEFETVKWVQLSEIPRLIIAWRHPVYERVVELFGEIEGAR